MILALALLACGPVVEEDTDRPDRPVRDTDPVEPAGPPVLVINEIMSRNNASWADELGNRPDWIELFNPSADDVSLEGWTILDGDPDTDAEPEPLHASLGVPAGGFLVLACDGLPDLGPTHLDFALSGEGDRVALYAPDGSGTIVTFGDLPDDVSIARLPDGCAGDCWTYAYGGTPGASNVVVEPVVEEIVPKGSVWRYLDAGAAPSGWAGPGFDDSGWAAGPGPLGYGDTHVVTTVGFGADEADKRVTTWLRLAFTLEEASSGAAVRLLRDDGAVVYLDGVEVLRDNMPSGAITADTLALAAVGDSGETAYTRLALEAGLAAGGHVIAVELHQASPSSSDLGFDLAVEVIR